MKILLVVITFMCIGFSLPVTAQNTIAKLKYEQAEEAFAKNDFFTSLAKLEETEKLLGEINPKVLHLRILVQAKLLDVDSSYLPALRQNCNLYLKNYDNPNLEEKYKEVYFISESLVQYEPNTDCEKGLAYLNSKEYELALSYFKKAAQNGYGRAMNGLGVLYENGFGVPKNWEEAFSWYKRAAEKADKKGLYNLGRAYYHGIGVAQNYTEALSVFQQAAAKNVPEAYTAIADTYFAMNDFSQAFDYYKKEAASGKAWCTFRLGWMYYEGTGVTQDYKKAFDLFYKLAEGEKGETAAMNYIGIMYYYGRGVPVDKGKAVEWYTKAAEKGDYYALGNLASLYETGDGIKRDRKKAKELREKQAKATKY